MNLVYIGKVTSTHGIKGEIKIKSNFQFKKNVFKVGNHLIIDNCKYIIKGYRVHKGFDMVCINDYKDINEVLFLIGKKVYFDRDCLNLLDDEVLDSDLISYNVVTTNGDTGVIKEIFYASPTNKIVRVFIDKEYLIPLNSPFIKCIDKSKKLVTIELMEGM